MSIPAVCALLKVGGLRVAYKVEGKSLDALNGASLQIQKGEVVGILGESGCGKSTLAKAILRLLPKTAEISAGTMDFDGTDLARASEREMQAIRGARIALIWQEPGLALSPFLKIGEQVAQVLRTHHRWEAKRSRQWIEELLSRVGLVDATRRFYDAYPHQLSGGQQQRVAIVLAMACQPELLVADEPTASLDSDAEAEVLGALRTLLKTRNASLLLITHDPRMLVGFADRVAVMYGGRVIESGPLASVFQRPAHPYTRALLACVPKGDAKLDAGIDLPTIAGSAPDPDERKKGCVFAPRCVERMEVCDARRPVNVAVQPDTEVECFLHER